MLITARTPMGARSRSLMTALVWLVLGLGGTLGGGLVFWLGFRPVYWLVSDVVFLMGGKLDPPVLALGFQIFDKRMWLIGWLIFGLVVGLVGGLNNGGWFVLLQKFAHRHLSRIGNLPPRPYDFLEWGIEQQIFRRVGGGVRFRHNLIQQHLANTSEGVR
jgi:hypothetical protein